MTKSTFFLLLSNFLTMLVLHLAFIQSLTSAIAFRPTNETDRFALLALKDRIHEDPLGVMDSWNESFHFCNWKGVTCSKRHEGRVTGLNLTGQKLVGSLPPHIGNLSFMRQIDLSSNNFKGEIPQEVGHLFRLKDLDLSGNDFQGKIPSNLSFCSSLENIDLSFNGLLGEIPMELGNLRNSLRALALSANNLTGSIPQWLGNASSLEKLFLAQNNLRGSILDELGGLAKLQYLQLSSNHLSSKVPRSVFNLSSVSMLSVTENQLHGRIPSDVGFTLPNLELLLISVNNFYGEVPPSLLNATRLRFLDMGANNFSGGVPSDIGRLRNLVPAQVYNRENGHVGFMLSCYDAELSYDPRTDTFQARYPPHGKRAVAIESGVSWERLRSPPVDTSPHDLHVTDCLNELHPGDHIEIQWRRNKEFPYGWWYGIVGHMESCDGNTNYCQCHGSDSVVLEFNQYTLGSRWRRTTVSRKDHREEGNEADGFYGGIRKFNTGEEISTWKQLWPSGVEESVAEGKMEIWCFSVPQFFEVEILSLFSN